MPSVVYWPGLWGTSGTSGRTRTIIRSGLALRSPTMVALYFFWRSSAIWSGVMPASGLFQSARPPAPSDSGSAAQVLRFHTMTAVVRLTLSPSQESAHASMVSRRRPGLRGGGHDCPGPVPADIHRRERRKQGSRLEVADGGAAAGGAGGAVLLGGGLLPAG